MTKEKSPYIQGFDAAEGGDPRGRRANPFEYHSKDWWQWEYGWGDYWDARGQMQDDDGYDGRAENEDDD